MSKVLAIARFTLLEALRTRLPWLVLVALGILVLASLFVQQLAIAESARVQTGFLAATARLAAVFVLCLHVASSMAREFNDKGIELLLSLDLPRTGYFFGKLLGFGGTALLVAGMTTFALAWVAPNPGLALWGVSLLCELLLVVALTLFCALTFAQIMPAVSFVAAFYLLARSIGAIRLISGSELLPQREWTQRVLGWLVDGLSLLLPDLGRFTSTGWLVDGSGGLPAIAFVAAQTAVYGTLIVLAGLFDLYRKNL
jgi:ABC-type transport system involved in multi-copper enzyme maturation permease subunit